MSVAADLAAVEASISNPAANSGADNPQTNKFQEAISAWRAVDLNTLVTGLDTTASDIVTYQRDSTIQRKELAQKTKDFRKSDDATKLSEIKGLLKAYQTFIDLLTNHSKAINSNFLKAYTSLSEVPDPYPLLEASVDSMLIAEDTLPKLTEENGRLQKSITKLTSQLEETEANLQTERNARKDLEANLEKRVKDVESSWTLATEEKKGNWEAKEKALEEKIESQEQLIREIKASYEVNQRLGEGASEPTTSSGVTSAELRMLHSDLERASSRLTEVEARNEQLRIELAQAKSEASSQKTSGSLEDDPGYMRMRNENSSLIRKLDASRVERDGIRREFDGKFRNIEREIAHLKEERDSLKHKVERWSDYEDVKQELEVLKSIEFSTGDDDEGQDSLDTSDPKAKGDTLEKLLLARNKKLSDELTILRVSHQDLQTRLQTLQNDMATTKGELVKAQTLNEKLENDLSNFQAEPSSHFSSGASVAGTYVSRYSPSVMGGRKGRVSPTSSIISGMPGERESPFGSLAPGNGANNSQAGGILPMITAQRDRFKKRNAQLEQELHDTHRTVSSLRQEVASLQRDNLNLYEKTRYVSTYNRGGGASHATTSSSAAATTSSLNANPSAVNIGSTGNPGIALDRYRKAYESNISPFAAFRGRESARAYKRMSLPERVVYSITRMVLASRTSRNLFAMYCLALHLLVFFVLFSMDESPAVPLHATSSDTDWKAKTKVNGALP
ncbi:Protein CASP [Ceratocystis fimbriata CBS 114723]|uniref:Protein CASP n=1 Tax=Ceratocystis fimbriata CBS 114723 TaxID=1035309 RepID=A0A2C5WGN3_9PEZI|nr:Protein CASP [Ceratocystis fimbriata CBS 114723]